MSDEDTLEIGFREDGIFWLTASSDIPDADAAERYMASGDEAWQVVSEVHLRGTGEWEDTKSERWEECQPDEAGARPGWKLVNAIEPEILDDMSGEWVPNPHFDSSLARSSRS